LKQEQPIIAMESFFNDGAVRGKAITEILKEIGYVHFYELVPKYAVTRGIIAMRLNKFLLWLIPEHWRKTLILRKLETLDGADCSLTILSRRDLTV